MKKLVLIIALLVLTACTKNDVLIDLGYTEEEAQIIYDNQACTGELEIYDTNIVLILQNKEFKCENYNNYISYLNKYKTSIDEAVVLVNKDITDVYHEKLVDLTEEKYFVSKNLNRYLDYLEKNNDTKLVDVIRNVNANIDNDFYTNTKESDLSKGILVMVNKFYKLPSDFEPQVELLGNNYTTTPGKGKLTKEAKTAFEKMCDAALKDNVSIKNKSAYRSYSLQKSIHNSYVSVDGQALVDTYSARPGHSEHQTGLVSDITTKNLLTGKIDDFDWMINNSYKYGFILRYPKDKVYLTGYQYEPWHYRYVGIDVATMMHENDLTFEEYYAFYVEN